MKKTFEISSYGVEEMNQQELLMVDGGGLPSWGEVKAVLQLTGGRIGIIGKLLYDFISQIWTPDKKGTEIEVEVDDFMKENVSGRDQNFGNLIKNNLLEYLDLRGVTVNIYIYNGDTTRNHK